MRIIGFDPGLQKTGWGIIEAEDNRLRHVANGVVRTRAADDLATRLKALHDGLTLVVESYRPAEAAVEQSFANKNPTATLKLGQARGIALLVPAQAGLTVVEYLPNLVKKTVVGAGHAAKEQIQAMIAVLLPAADVANADAADALAVAICHAHHRQTAGRIARFVEVAS